MRGCAQVCTIVLEVHVSTQLQMASAKQLRLMADFWRYYIDRAGFRLWYVHRNTGNPHGVDSNVHPLLVALGMDEAVCCFEIGLHRPQCSSGDAPDAATASHHQPRRPPDAAAGCRDSHRHSHHHTFGM